MTLEIPPDQYHVIVLTGDIKTFEFFIFEIFRIVYWVCCIQFSAFFDNFAIIKVHCMSFETYNFKASTFEIL